MEVHVPSLVVRGGAAVPGDVGNPSFGYPLARLRADDEGVEVSIRPAWVARAWFNAADWRCAYGDLKHVYVSKRGFLFVLKEGRGCRFSVVPEMRRYNELLVEPARKLQDILAGHDVKLIPVGSVRARISEIG